MRVYIYLFIVLASVHIYSKKVNFVWYDLFWSEGLQIQYEVLTNTVQRPTNRDGSCSTLFCWPISISDFKWRIMVLVLKFFLHPHPDRTALLRSWVTPHPLTLFSPQGNKCASPRFNPNTYGGLGWAASLLNQLSYEQRILLRLYQDCAHIYDVWLVIISHTNIF